MTRDQLIFCAKVYLAQSRHFTKRARKYSFVLLAAAEKARKEVFTLSTKPEPAPQMELF